MGRGGKRSGAGRPKGSTTKRTRKIIEKHEAKRGSMMPLDVMLRAMQEHADADDWDGAAKIAALAAPYTHPKLAAVEHSGPGGGPIKTETKPRTNFELAKAVLHIFESAKHDPDGPV